MLRIFCTLLMPGVLTDSVQSNDSKVSCYEISSVDAAESSELCTKSLCCGASCECQSGVWSYALSPHVGCSAELDVVLQHHIISIISRGGGCGPCTTGPAGGNALRGGHSRP